MSNLPYSPADYSDGEAVCAEAVERAGQCVPCDKPAVAYAKDINETGEAYPVCAYHTRKDTALPLPNNGHEWITHDLGVSKNWDPCTCPCHN